MKPSFCFVVVAACLLLVCCGKKPFKSGTGLYSIKQYHNSEIMTPGDTIQLANVKISTVSMDNNYLSWNGITFRENLSTDSVVTYINDSVISGNYQIVYTLQYFPKTDKVVVINPAMIINNNTTKLWTSF